MTVPWREWSADAFALAAAQGKPVLLSIVTAWSEGCAAMDGSAFANDEVAELVRERFVAVRVDANRRPDIDERYNLGGWPTTVFLTPDGQMLFGGTYFDAEALASTLRRVDRAFHERSHALEAPSAAATVQAARDAGIDPPVDPAAAADRIADAMCAAFDETAGGFGPPPRRPHADLLLVAISRAADDARFREMAEGALEALRALWDPTRGGYVRSAACADWSYPAIERTLEDQAALLQVFTAASRLLDSRWAGAARELAGWVRTAMTGGLGGYFNAFGAHGADPTVYVDANAQMTGAMIQTAIVLGDAGLRDHALRVFEDAVVPAYRPGAGMAHAHGDASCPTLLTDQVHTALALTWLHAATGQLPYSMLLAELLHFAIREMWDGDAGAFRDRRDREDPLAPFELNCRAAVALNRLAAMTGDRDLAARGVGILTRLAADAAGRGLFAGAYAVAVAEVFEGRAPEGLELTPVDWQLG